MQDWIAHIISVNQTETWDATLNQYIVDNHLSSPDIFKEKFAQLQALPGFRTNAEKNLPILLTTGDPESALQQLHDYLAVFQAKQGNVFDFSHPHSHWLLLVFGRSSFLARQLIRNPEWGIQTIESPYLHQKKELATMESELNTLLSKTPEWTIDAFKKALRTFKYLEYLRLTIRDYGNLADPVDILEELSSVASCCVEAALKAAHQFAQSHGLVPVESLLQAHPNEPLIILGMGKLGGNELNYSSDIDPIILCTDASILDDPSHKLRQHFNKVIRTLISILSNVTEDGFIVRVDMRLRPGGNTSPLVRSVGDTENYYFMQGALWERQALIKARAVAGNREEGNLFLNRMSSFIYNKLVDQNMIQEIQQLKQRIEKEHLKQHLNVKLGVGGIREIEFFVQIFQLLYGGSKPNLRCTNTLKAIEVLKQNHYLLTEDAETLKNSYLFLRKLEHRLQMEEEYQVHIIPGIRRKQEILARSMGYLEKDVEVARRHLLQDVTDIMSRVRTIFGGLFDQSHHEVSATIQNHLRYAHYTDEMKRTIDDSARQFTSIIQQSPNLMVRFQRLFEQIGAKIEYYEYLLKYPAVLHRLSKIAETSEFLWNHLMNHLNLLHQLDATEVLHTREDWENQLDQLMASATSEEDQLNVLRNFKHSITFLIGSAELEGILPYTQARLRLTTLAEVIIQKAYQLVLDYLVEQYGSPQTESGPAFFSIIGLGKLGGREFTYHSDLDLVFICSDVGYTSGERRISNYQFYAKLAQRFMSTLTAFTAAGYAYKVDTRLRPSGDGGPLCNSLSNYQNYHKKSQAWEHQALIKGRIVGGDLENSWIEKLNHAIQSTVYNWTPPDDLKDKILHLRRRKENELSKETATNKNIKEGYGGLLDIEFLCQYLQLKHGQTFPDLRVPRTLDVLKRFQGQGILSQETAETLEVSYVFLRLLECYLRLHCDSDTHRIDFQTVQHDKIVKLLHYQGIKVADLESDYHTITNDIRTIFEKTFVDH